MEIPEAPKTWKDWFRHAFALDGVAEPLSEADALLLDKVAQGVVLRRMTAPALLFLESVKPLSFIGSQTLVFFGPLLEMVLKREEIERGTKLLERRDVLETMALRIETLEAERRG
ncbi:MAG: hypothetical protein K8T20_06410 [Planctomycetes bacterium]|nr:hypothetical protein [Planctomycetota bacterium]